MRTCFKCAPLAADMNNYCPVNSSTQVAGQCPYQAFLSVYASCKSAVSLSFWRPAIHVSGHNWHEDLKQSQQNFISHAFRLGEYLGWSLAFKLTSFLCNFCRWWS